MTRLIAMVSIGGLALSVAANASPVSRSADLTLTLQVRSLPGAVITATGATVTVDSTAGTLAIAGGQIFQTLLTAPIRIPATSWTAVQSVVFTGISNRQATFRIGGGSVTLPTTEAPCPSASPIASGIACVTAAAANLGGPMGLGGSIFPILAGNPPVTVGVPLFQARIGMGGTARVPNTSAGFFFDNAPWTVGAGKVRYLATTRYTTLVPYTIHLMGSGTVSSSTYTTVTNSWLTTATQAGSGNLATGATPPNGSTITLVTPTYVSVLGNIFPVYSKLEIQFVPEPGTLLLLGAGLAGLAAGARRLR